MPDSVATLAAALQDRYRIERELGQGGMATVYLAHDVRHDRQVAVKVLHPDLAAALGGERFLSEIKTTARLQHPHILPLLDSGQADGGVGGQLFYVMPYIAGETLRARLEREKQLPLADAVRIAREVADALGAAHGLGIVHRDIKPENILLQGGHALVADFGIALAVQQAGGSRMTQTGMSLGTPQYMSPEQAMGEKAVDARADIYALGAVAYEMLTGDPPFTGSTVQAIVAKIMATEPERISTIRRTVPPHVEAAVHTALAKLPADRWSSAAEFSSALAGSTTALLPAARPARGSWSAQLRQPLTLALGIASLVLGSLLLAARGFRSDPAPAEVVRFTPDLPAGLNMLFSRLLSGTPIASSPDGRRIAFLAEDNTGLRQLYTRALDDQEPRLLPGSEGAYMPHFSPDGGALAFYANGRLLRVALDGGQPQPIAETSQMSGLTWSPSGQLVLGLNGGLATVAAAGGPIRPWTAPDTTRGETFQQFPVALADGEHVLYSSWGGGGIETVRIGVASLPSGRTRILDVTGTAALGVVDGWLVFATTAGALMAVQVELESGIVRGTPVTLLNGLLVGSGGGPRATLSHSGSLVYMGGSRESTLALVDAAGKLTPLLPEVRPYGYPRYSPDGSRIAYSLVGAAGSDIYVYDLASRTPTRLRTGGAINERPEWSADGERILFRTDQAVRTAIWWMPVDQSGPPEPLISSPREAAFEAVMTPDGKYLVFQEDTIGADVWYRALSPDSAPRPIATSRSIENMARVSPNGRWVAFVTDASGLNQVVVQPFPGPGARVQVSSAGGAEPVWARDGRRIFYRANQKLMVATVSTESGFRVTGRSVFADDLFMSAQSPHANFDVTPDGQRLLVLKGQLDPRLIVVHNWAAELRARVAGARP